MVLRGTTYTLYDILEDINANLYESADSLWTPSQKKNAIQKAVRDARPEWWEERIDDTHTYDYTQHRYDLPPACAIVEAVSVSAPNPGNPRKDIPAIDWHIEGDELVFEESHPQYNGETLYIIYLYYQKNLLDISGDDLVSVAGSAQVTSDSSTFITDGVEAGDRLIKGGVNEYYVVSVDSETQLTLNEEMEMNGISSFTVAGYTDMPHEYLVSKAMAELYLASAMNRPGAEVENAIQLSDYYRQLARQALQRNRRHPKPRRMY